jgi:hypothetical protein
MRRTKALQRQKQQQQKQQVQGSQQQQEGVESEGEGEDMDVVVIETQQEEEGAVATQQEPGGDGGLHADAGHPDEEFHDAAEAGTSDVRVAAGGAGDMEVDPAAGNRPGQQPQEHGTAGGAAPVQPLAPQQPLLSTSQVEPPIRGAPQEPQPDPEALPVCEDLIQQLVAATRGWLLGQLEVLHAQVGGTELTCTPALPVYACAGEAVAFVPSVLPALVEFLLGDQDDVCHDLLN